MASEFEDLSIRELEKELEQARHRYAKLKAQASKRAFKDVLLTYSGETGTLSSGPESDDNAASKTSEKAAENSKRRRIEATHVAYRIAGHTIFPVAPHKSGIRFDTSCFGEYHEQYYVFLHFQDTSSVKIFKHTLPSFVRVDEQAKDLHLGSGLKRFMVDVSTCLNAYVNRREQVRQLERRHSDVILNRQIISSAAFDFVKFTVEDIWGRDSDDDDATKYYTIQLLYEDLNSTIPSRCVVKHVTHFDTADTEANEDGSIHGIPLTGDRNRVLEKALKTSAISGLHEALSVAFSAANTP